MVRLAIRCALLLPVLASVVCGAGAFLTSAAQAADWPQFRGPNRTDVSDEKNLLKQWPVGGPPLVWKGDGLGEGYSSMAIVGDRIYSMGDKGDSSFLTASDRATGKFQWEAAVGKPGGNYKGTRCTPTVDGDRVYAIGQFGDLICCNAASGVERWRKNFQKDFGGRNGGWNYTESPLVDGDRLVCTPGGNDATMVALNKLTGEVIWKGVVPGGDTAGYSSMVISEATGVRQYVQLMANGLVGFAAADGKMLWRYGDKGDRFGGNTANIPTPIVHGDYIFATAGYGRGGALIKLVGTAAGINAEEVYFSNSVKNRHGGVVMIGDYIYGDLDDSGNPWCAEWKTGKPRWKKDKPSEGRGSAAVTYADGRLYFQYQNGFMALVDASPEAYHEISSFKIPEPKRECWSHPVVVGGKLYVRSQDNLWCYDITQR
jgi:outer membrane protein assembly factor BamB